MFHFVFVGRNIHYRSLRGSNPHSLHSFVLNYIPVRCPNFGPYIDLSYDLVTFFVGFLGDLSRLDQRFFPWKDGVNEVDPGTSEKIRNL